MYIVHDLQYILFSSLPCERNRDRLLCLYMFYNYNDLLQRVPDNMPCSTATKHQTNQLRPSVIPRGSRNQLLQAERFSRDGVRATIAGYTGERKP